MQSYKYCLILFSIGVGAIAVINRSNYSAIAHSAESDLASNARVGFNQKIAHFLQAANRAQQAYYFEQARFAQNKQELSQSGFSLSDDDHYRLTMKSKDNAAFIYGIPEQDYGTYKETP